MRASNFELALGFSGLSYISVLTMVDGVTLHYPHITVVGAVGSIYGLVRASQAWLCWLRAFPWFVRGADTKIRARALSEVKAVHSLRGASGAPK